MCSSSSQSQQDLGTALQCSGEKITVIKLFILQSCMQGLCWRIMQGSEVPYLVGDSETLEKAQKRMVSMITGLRTKKPS